MPNLNSILLNFADPRSIDRYKHGQTTPTQHPSGLKRYMPKSTFQAAEELFDIGPCGIRLWKAFDGSYKRHRDHHHPEISMCIADCTRAAKKLKPMFIRVLEFDPALHPPSILEKADWVVAWSRLSYQLLAAQAELSQTLSQPDFERHLSLLKSDELFGVLLEQCAFFAFGATKSHLNGSIELLRAGMIFFQGFPSPLSHEQAIVYLQSTNNFPLQKIF